MIYTIDGRELKLRDRATFKQVRNTITIFTQLEIEENAPTFEIIDRIGGRINDFMQIIFDGDDTAAEIDWNDAPFDDLVQIITDFFGSSVQLKSLLNGLKTIFRSLGMTIPIDKSPGPIDTTGNASSTGPPEEAGASKDN